jgi:hypothetical protein
MMNVFCDPLSFQPKVKNYVFHHSTGYQNCISVLANSVILLGLPNLSRNLLITLLISILSAIKPRFQGNHATNNSRGYLNQMWVLQNSKDLFEYIKLMSLSSCNSIKTFDFSTHYTIPLSTLKVASTLFISLFVLFSIKRRFKKCAIISIRFFLSFSRW